METYKKPVVASKNKVPSSMPTMPFALIAKVFPHADDFHIKNSLTPRKNFVE